jgi:hypothetical protein
MINERKIAQGSITKPIIPCCAIENAEPFTVCSQCKISVAEKEVQRVPEQ